MLRLRLATMDSVYQSRIRFGLVRLHVSAWYFIVQLRIDTQYMLSRLGGDEERAGRYDEVFVRVVSDSLGAFDRVINAVGSVCYAEPCLSHNCLDLRGRQGLWMSRRCRNGACRLDLSHLAGYGFGVVAGSGA